jgi:hypothetical protein
MSRRDELKQQAVAALRDKIGDFHPESSEYWEELVLVGEIDGKPLTARVSFAGEGENPGVYGGESMWRVELIGESGPLHRPHNPGPTLEHHLSDFDWSRVKTELDEQ